MRKYLLIFVLSAFLLGSCSSKVKESWKEVKSDEVQKVYSTLDDLILSVDKNVHKISSDLLKKKIASGKKFYLIDLREADEVSNGVIEGSTNIPRGLLEFRLLKTFPGIKNNDEIVLYCKKGDRSVLAANSLQQLGFINVYTLEGGYNNFMGIQEETAPQAAPVPVAAAPAATSKPSGAAPVKKKGGGGGC